MEPDRPRIVGRRRSTAMPQNLGVADDTKPGNDTAATRNPEIDTESRFLQQLLL
jgi:hypothetical protein